MARRIFFLFWPLLFLVLALTRPTNSAPLSLPLRLDVGGSVPYVAQDGDVYLPDQPWTPGNPAGYLGGYVQLTDWWDGLGGTADPTLHQSYLIDWQEYRISQLPAGSYIVTLHFSDSQAHRAGQSLFSIAMEGQTVLNHLDLFATVGGDYALTYRFLVPVYDGELNINATIDEGHVYLAALGVDEAVADTTPPAPPAGLQGDRGYHAGLLHWAANEETDLAGYHVYRADTPAGSFTRLTTRPVTTPRYADPVALPANVYYYRLTAIDLFGNESAPGASVSLNPLNIDNATLPVLDLAMTAQNVQTLYDYPLRDDDLPGLLTLDGTTYPVTARFRGSLSRSFPKKSWKIYFAGDSPYANQDRINANADYADWSLIHGPLSASLFEAAGVRPAYTEPLLLRLNGDYLGVYNRYEQIDEAFLARTGRDPDATVYKVNERFAELLPNLTAYEQAYEQETNEGVAYDEIIRFIELINNTPDDQFPAEIARAFDVPAYLHYYAVIVLTSNTDFTYHNVYLAQDSHSGRWELIPWDLDFSWGITPGEMLGERRSDYPIDMGTSGSPLWSGSNVLLDRVLAVPQYRAYYCQVLDNLLSTAFSPAELNPLIDSAHIRVREAGLADWQKLGWEDSARFLGTPAGLKQYANERRTFLAGEMAGYCPAGTPFVTLNEIVAANTILEDPDEPGEFPAWFELYNAGLSPLDLGGLYLSTNSGNPTMYQIPAGVEIPPLGHLIFWADDDPEQGSTHVNFTLNPLGGVIYLYDSDGTTQLDVRIFGTQTIDVALGRYLDGSPNWITFNVPTPGAANLFAPPLISNTGREPLQPTAGVPVTLTATITDDGLLLPPTLHYQAEGGGFTTLPLTALGGDQFRAVLPAYPAGTRVQYYLAAGDNDGQVTTDPAGATQNVHEYIVDYQPPLLLFNEFLASNEAGITDPAEPAEHPDWFELFNPSPHTIDLGGMYVTDDLGDLQFRLSDELSIKPGQYLLFYADSDPEQGVYHTNFKLSSGGEALGLYDTAVGLNLPLDSRTFGPQTEDVSEGRCPSGAAAWVLMNTPTPGSNNNTCGLSAPIIGSVQPTTPFPAGDEPVTIQARVQDESVNLAVTLWYSATGGFVSLPMARVGSILYEATVPARPDGALVVYYVTALDEDGLLSSVPRLAPAYTLAYRAGYSPPPVYLNELLAENESRLVDPAEPDETPDWLELFNGGPTPLNLGGYYLTDDLADPTKFRIPAGTVIPAGGFLLFYADDDPEQGPDHLNFTLSSYGDVVALFAPDGQVLLDSYSFGRQLRDQSSGRLPDGTGTWQRFTCVTPGAPNGCNYAVTLPFVRR